MATLKIDRGTTFNIGIVYKKDGIATSLVGATVRFTMKTSEYDSSTDDSTASIVKNVTDGDENGEATIVLDPADTATLDPGKYYYDVKVQESGGDIFKVDEGKIKLDGSPTNRLS